jgi:hypothetical protein
MIAVLELLTMYFSISPWLSSMLIVRNANGSVFADGTLSGRLRVVLNFDFVETIHDNLNGLVACSKRLMEKLPEKIGNPELVVYDESSGFESFKGLMHFRHEKGNLVRQCPNYLAGSVELRGS